MQIYTGPPHRSTLLAVRFLNHQYDMASTNSAYFNFVVCSFLRFNPIALRKAKIAYNFVLSECSGIKGLCSKSLKVSGVYRSALTTKTSSRVKLLRAVQFVISLICRVFLDNCTTTRHAGLFLHGVAVDSFRPFSDHQKLSDSH